MNTKAPGRPPRRFAVWRPRVRGWRRCQVIGCSDVKGESREALPPGTAEHRAVPGAARGADDGGLSERARSHQRPRRPGARFRLAPADRGGQRHGHPPVRRRRPDGRQHVGVGVARIAPAVRLQEPAPRDRCAARKQWFEPLEGPILVLWWIPAGQIPTVAEAQGRLQHLKDHGPTAHAFTFRTPFPAPDESTHGLGAP